jgi:hypothetical protein
MKANFRIAVLDYTSGVIGIHNFENELSEEEVEMFLSKHYHLEDIYYMCGKNLIVSESWDPR